MLPIHSGGDYLLDYVVRAGRLDFPSSPPRTKIWTMQNRRNYETTITSTALMHRDADIRLAMMDALFAHGLDINQSAVRQSC